MKKCKIFFGFLIGGLVLIPLMLSCASLGFYDRSISMKESCVLDVQKTISGNAQLYYLGANSEKGQVDSIGEYKEIFTGSSGKNTIIVPAGTFSLGYSNTLKKVLARTDYGWYVREVYKMENYSAVSEPFTFEAGKRYRLAIFDATSSSGRGTITITEMNNGGISSGGVMVAPKSQIVANTLGWRYSNGFLIGEVGPQIGMYIASDAMVMHITGEATLGMGIFGGENNGFGFPYRAGGSVITYFGKGFLGAGLGGGITGQTIMLLGDEGNDMFPKIQVPYLQGKILFNPDVNGAIGFGVFFDYYPTVKPVGIGSFGFGLAINY